MKDCPLCHYANTPKKHCVHYHEYHGSAMHSKLAAQNAEVNAGLTLPDWDRAIMEIEMAGIAARKRKNPAALGITLGYLERAIKALNP